MLMPRRRLFSAAVLLALTGLPSLTKAVDAIQLVGSDLMGPAFRQAVVRFGETNETDVMLNLAGTRLGREAMYPTRSQVGIFVTRDGNLPLAEGQAKFLLGYHTLVAVASKELPVDQLSFSQLGAIFGAGEAATQLRWGEFGARGEWRGRAILPKIVSGKGAIVHDLLSYAVLRSGRFKATVEILPSRADVLAAVRANDGALGIVPALAAGDADLKVLLLAVDEGNVAFGPTPENVHAGDYPIRLPIYVTFYREQARELTRFLRFLLSEEVAEALKADAVIPLPISVRNQQVFDLEVL